MIVDYIDWSIITLWLLTMLLVLLFCKSFWHVYRTPGHPDKYMLAIVVYMTLSGAISIMRILRL